MYNTNNNLSSNLSNNVDWDSAFTDFLIPSDIGGFASLPNFGGTSAGNTVTGFNADGSFNFDGAFKDWSSDTSSWDWGFGGGGGDTSWLQKNLGVSGKDVMGGLSAFGSGLQGIGSIVGGVGALKTAGIARDSLNFNKVVARANYEQQAKLTNERLATRYNTRINSNRRYQDLSKEDKDAMTASYMSKYGANDTLGA